MTSDDIPAVHRALKREYERHEAPVIEFIHAQTGSTFKVLVATILSARTKDETTTQVVRKLFDVVSEPADLRRIPLARLEKLLHPVGFFRTKAKHLKALPDVLDREFQGRIPDTIDDLCKLPGVGRKTANLVVAVAFDKYGICVDVHVHRITNRLGLINTRAPFETEMKLREILPKRYWKSWNRQLVSFGQTRCRPRNPKCCDCSIAAYCDRTGVQDPA
jgi:endonuclease III